MSERSSVDYKRLARRAFEQAKSDIRDAGVSPRRSWVLISATARMRNAVVAYHAGEPWMHPAAFHAGVSRATDLMDDAMQAENARLRAEVERLRGLCAEACFMMGDASLEECWPVLFGKLADIVDG